MKFESKIDEPILERPKSQTEVDRQVLDFLGDYKINEPNDLIPLIDHIKKSLEFREYDEETSKYADSIQWKRTVSEIIKDGYVYDDKACSDLVMVLITMCKALGFEAQLVKLVNLRNDNSHSIAEIKIKGDWYRIDPSFPVYKPFKGYLGPDDVWNKDWCGGWKVWRRGDDLWSMGLTGIEAENLVYESSPKHDN